MRIRKLSRLNCFSISLKGVIHYDDACKLLCYRRERNDLRQRCASFIDAIGAVTAPIWTLDNVKTFNTNIVTLVGNTFLSKVVNQTIGVLFSGNTTWKAVGAIPKTPVHHQCC